MGPEWRRDFAAVVCGVMAVLSLLAGLLLHPGYLLAALVLLIFLDEVTAR